MIGIRAAFTLDSFEALGGAEIQALATVNPDAYLLNNSIANVSSLHAGGITGAGVIVGDSKPGITPIRFMNRIKMNSVPKNGTCLADPWSMASCACPATKL